MNMFFLEPVVYYHSLFKKVYSNLKVLWVAYDCTSFTAMSAALDNINLILFNLILFIYFLTPLLEYNCFTMVC